MIVGLGLDIAEIDRMEAAIARHGAAFLESCSTLPAKWLIAKDTSTSMNAMPHASQPRKQR